MSTMPHESWTPRSHKPWRSRSRLCESVNAAALFNRHVRVRRSDGLRRLETSAAKKPGKRAQKFIGVRWA